MAEWARGWATNGTWSPPIWTHYVQFAQCRHMPQLLLLPYEDVCKSRKAAVLAIARHIGCDSSDARVRQVVRRTSKEFMSRHGRQFDDHWIHQQQVRRCCPRVLSPSDKVVSAHTSLGRLAVSAETREMLRQCWAREVAPATGFACYEDMRRQVARESLGSSPSPR